MYSVIATPVPNRTLKPKNSNFVLRGETTSSARAIALDGASRSLSHLNSSNTSKSAGIYINAPQTSTSDLEHGNGTNNSSFAVASTKEYKSSVLNQTNTSHVVKQSDMDKIEMVRENINFQSDTISHPTPSVTNSISRSTTKLKSEVVANTDTISTTSQYKEELQHQDLKIDTNDENGGYFNTTSFHNSNPIFRYSPKQIPIRKILQNSSDINKSTTKTPRSISHAITSFSETSHENENSHKGRITTKSIPKSEPVRPLFKPLILDIGNKSNNPNLIFSSESMHFPLHMQMNMEVKQTSSPTSTNSTSVTATTLKQISNTTKPKARKDFDTETEIITSKYSCMNTFPLKLNLTKTFTDHSSRKGGKGGSKGGGAALLYNLNCYSNYDTNKLNYENALSKNSSDECDNQHDEIDDQSSVYSLTTPENRWKAMSQFAGSHKQDQNVLDLSHRTDSLTPESLKYGVPPALAPKVLDLRCQEDGILEMAQRQREQEQKQKSEQNINGANFLSIRHPTLTHSSSFVYYKNQENMLMCFGHRFGSYEADLPAFLDVIARLFPNLLHVTITPTKKKQSNGEIPFEDTSDYDNINVQGAVNPENNSTTTSNDVPSSSLRKKEAAQQEAMRMKRLYIIFRLPNLLSINLKPVTDEERRMARPNVPNGYKVKKEYWLTRAMQDWEEKEEIEPAPETSDALNSVVTVQHGTIESWESMSSGGIECSLPEYLPKASGERDDQKNINSTLTDALTEHDKNSGVFNRSRSISSLKSKKSVNYRSDLLMRLSGGSSFSNEPKNEKVMSQKKDSSDGTISGTIRRRIPNFSSKDHNTLSSNNDYISSPRDGLALNDNSSSASMDPPPLLPATSSSNHTTPVLSHKSRFKNRRPPTSPASILRPIPLTKAYHGKRSKTNHGGSSWNRSRWGKGSGIRSRRRPIAPSTSMADEEDDDSEDE